MTVKVGASSAWKDVGASANKISVGASSAWKQVLHGWVGAGGVWKKFYDAVFVQLSNTSAFKTSVSPADAYAGYGLSSAGNTQKCEGTSASFSTLSTWLVQGSASDYEVMCTVSGSALASGTTGSWLGLGTTRQWYISILTNGNSSKSSTLTIQIRDVATSTVQATCTVTLDCTVEI